MARLKTKGGQKAMLTISGTIPEITDQDTGKLKPGASIRYLSDATPVINFTLAIQDGSKKQEDGTWTKGISQWFNFELWPGDKNKADEEWIAKLKPGAGIVIFNATAKLSKDKDGKVWTNWRVDPFNGIVVFEAPASAGGSAAGQPSSGKSWSVDEDSDE